MCSEAISRGTTNTSTAGSQRQPRRSLRSTRATVRRLSRSPRARPPARATRKSSGNLSTHCCRKNCRMTNKNGWTRARCEELLGRGEAALRRATERRPHEQDEQRHDELRDVEDPAPLVEWKNATASAERSRGVRVPDVGDQRSGAPNSKPARTLSTRETAAIATTTAARAGSAARRSRRVPRSPTRAVSPPPTATRRRANRSRALRNNHRRPSTRPAADRPRTRHNEAAVAGGEVDNGGAHRVVRAPRVNERPGSRRWPRRRPHPPGDRATVRRAGRPGRAPRARGCTASRNSRRDHRGPRSSIDRAP